MRTRLRERVETPLTLGELEKEHIEEMLVATCGNRRLAAQLLGISTSTLFRKLARYGLSRPRATAEEGSHALSR